MSLQRADIPIAFYKKLSRTTIASNENGSSNISLISLLKSDDYSEDLESDQEKQVPNKQNAHRNAVRTKPDNKIKKTPADKSAEKQLKKHEQQTAKVPLHHVGKRTKSDRDNRRNSIQRPENKKSLRLRTQESHKPTVGRHFRDEPVICEECGKENKTLTFLDRKASWSCDCPPHTTHSSSTSLATAQKRAKESLYYDEYLKYLPTLYLYGKPNRPPKKTNPHDRYNMYKKMWNKHRIPGENIDPEIRWCVRAIMLTGKDPEIESYILKRKDAIERAKNMKS